MLQCLGFSPFAENSECSFKAFSVIGNNGSSLQNILGQNISLKARKLAYELGVDKSELNSFLYKHPDLYIQNSDTHEWSLVKPSELIINFPEVSWLYSNTFEQILGKADSPLDSQVNKITFIIGNQCSILLEAASRFLALCNQLIMIGKTVTVDFSACCVFSPKRATQNHSKEPVIIIWKKPAIPMQKSHLQSCKNSIYFKTSLRNFFKISLEEFRI